jgi:uncharacterized membrane protein YgaE (UPF0421/DUF939 family)
VKLSWLRPSAVSALQVSTRAAVAAALSVVIADRVGLEFPLYALIAAIIVTDLSPLRTRELGLQRLTGTVIGATVGAATSVATAPVTHSGVLRIIIGVLAAMLISNVIGSPAATKLAGYVCGIVLLNFNDHPWSYASYRFVETIIGITTAVVVSFIPKLLKVADETELASKRIHAEK